MSQRESVALPRNGLRVDQIRRRSRRAAGAGGGRGPVLKLAQSSVAYMVESYRPSTFLTADELIREHPECCADQRSADVQAERAPIRRRAQPAARKTPARAEVRRDVERPQDLSPKRACSSPATFGGSPGVWWSQDALRFEAWRSTEFLHYKEVPDALG